MLTLSSAVVGHNYELPCTRALSPGTWIMSHQAWREATQRATFLGKSCGGTYVPGESLTAVYSGGHSEFILEVSGAIFTTGRCNGRRKSMWASAPVSTDASTGEITLWVAGASSEGAVTLSTECKLTKAVGAPPWSAWRA